MGCIYKQGRRYWIKYYQGGRPVYESSRSTRRGDAVRLLRMREGHLAEGRPFTPEALHLRFEDLAADLRSNFRSRGLRSSQRVDAALAHLKEVFGGWLASDITTHAINAYITRRRQQPARAHSNLSWCDSSRDSHEESPRTAEATINRELGVLKRAFNLAIAAGKLWHRPHIPMLREANARQGFFEPEMFERVRAELPDYLYGVITFAYYTGWRKGEILGLCWRQVDLEAGEVRLEPGTTKNGDGRLMILPDELREVLELLWERRAPDCEFVFHRDGERIGDFEKAWSNACKRAQCPGRLFHDLRRTAVRNMVRSGIAERVAMQITGHKTRAIFDRYHIVSEADLREAACRMAAFTGALHAKATQRAENSEAEHLAMAPSLAAQQRVDGYNLVIDGRSGVPLRHANLFMVKRRASSSAGRASPF